MISLEQDTEAADKDLVGTRVGCVRPRSDMMEQYGDKEETEKTTSSAFKLVLPKEGAGWSAKN